MEHLAEEDLRGFLRQALVLEELPPHHPIFKEIVVVELNSAPPPEEVPEVEELVLLGLT